MKMSRTFRIPILFAATITLFTLFSLEADRLQAQDQKTPQFLFPALPESLGEGNPSGRWVESSIKHQRCIFNSCNLRSIVCVGF